MYLSAQARWILTYEISKQNRKIRHISCCQNVRARTQLVGFLLRGPNGGSPVLMPRKREDARRGGAGALYYIGIMEKKMETTIMGFCRVYIGVILG